MRIGVPKEIKDHEYRVALTPAGVRELVHLGHEVLVEAGAGVGSRLPDGEYAAAGARIVPDAASAWGEADLVVKVKEPLPAEYPHLRSGLVLFTYLHLAANLEVTRALLDAGTTSYAYESVQLDDGSLPLLAPMSEIAGRLAPQVGAHLLTAPEGGRGVLLGGVPGVAPGHVVVLGGGVAGTEAARIAAGMRAEVTVLDKDLRKLRRLDDIAGSAVTTRASNRQAVEEAVARADLVIGTVLVPSARAPHLVTRDMVAGMRDGAVLVDVAIDQGGCFEDSHPTTHSDPAYRVGQTLFYCVANMPGAVPATSTQALTNATMPYLELLAEAGAHASARSEPLARGLATRGGELFSRPVAEAHGLPFAAGTG